MMFRLANYREWIFLKVRPGDIVMGLAGQTNEHGEPRFDNVSASPAAYQSFLKTGNWPDKTIMVLEIRDSDSHASINTGGHFQTGLAAVEVHVKRHGSLGRAAGIFDENRWR